MRNWLRPALGGVAFAMLLVGSWLALSWAPPDREMGDVQRIMYVHVPSVWMALLAVTLNFACSVLYLFKNSWKLDALAEASAEVGVVFGAVGVTLGSIWGRPTWGVYWTWDPRLTNAAIMLDSVKWWKSLHQVQSSPKTVDPDMVFVLRWNALGLLALMTFFIWSRYRIALRDRERELVLPEAVAPANTAQMQASGAAR